MAVIVEIDGLGKVEFDDSFRNLPPEEQQKAVNEVAQKHSSGQPSKPDDGIQESGIGSAGGAVVGGIGGATVGSTGGPAGTVVGGAAGAGLGSGVGTVVEEELIDYFAGRGVNVSSEEALNALKNAGIDAALTATGTLVIKTVLAPFASKALEFALNKAGIPNRFASSVAQIASNTDDVAKQVGKSTDVARYLSDRKLGSLWSNLSPSKQSALRTEYRDLWKSAFDDAIKVASPNEATALKYMQNNFGKSLPGDLRKTGISDETIVALEQAANSRLTPFFRKLSTQAGGDRVEDFIQQGLFQVSLGGPGSVLAKDALYEGGYIGKDSGKVTRGMPRGLL